MAISEQSRHELHGRLADVIGPDAAATLMEHLPPVGWADVATKRDLDAMAAVTKRDLDMFKADIDHRFDALEASLDHRFEVYEQRFRDDMHEAINKALTSQTRTILFGLIGSNLTVAALAFAAAGLR